jgi:LysR family glycine cleavage system transcriptional activator
MLINAALQGLGVALARTSLVADHLASGALVCPLKRTAPTAYTYYLLGLPEAVDRPKIAMFRRLLVAESAMTEASTASISQPMLRPVGDMPAAA